VAAEFESSTENTALRELIVARIRDEGGISFRDFMEMALYHPQHGYYTGDREKMGREGDYLTSPEVSPLFGAMVGRGLREMWEAIGHTEPFTIVECGGGNGTLARDILAWARRAAPDLFAAMRYLIVEVSGALRDRQQRRLAVDNLADRAEWHEAIPPGTRGCILSNELLDAMPVHRVKVEGGPLREVFVTWDGSGFAEELREPAPAIIEYFERLGLLPGEGCTAEVNPAAVEWVGEAGEALAEGFVLTFDYGYEAEELYAPWRTDGTLLGFYRHNPSTDPYARIGRQDLTSHVDFTSVRRAGEQAGLRTLGLTSQSEFLMGLGIQEALMGETGDLEERMARRQAVMELIDPGGLGRIRVLVQGKGVGGVTLTGWSP
jgi:SAM-dependent MidA family methyltransferase